MAPVTAGSGIGPVIAIDIGNTRTKIGIVDVEQGCCLNSGAFPTIELTSRLLPAITALQASGPRPLHAVIAAVVGTAAAEAYTILEPSGLTVRTLTSSAALPVTLRYTRPDTLGVDRLANALYAATEFPGQPVIIISAGTAMVIDYVAGGTFVGGAILPGVRLQFESLHQGTDRLPYVGRSPEKEIPPLPATSTGDCITGGVLRGCAAALGGIVAGYAALNPDSAPPVIITTGGDWPVLGTLVTFTSTYLPDMTLVGTARSLKFL